jgi:hypothetical protein
MNKKDFEVRWRLIRDQTKIWWGLITDADLKTVADADVKLFEYVSLLQLKYGMDRQFARNEIARRVKEFEIRVATVDPR